MVWLAFFAVPSMRALSTLLHPESRLRRGLHGAALLIFAGIVAAGSVPGARAEVGTLASGLVLHSLAYAALAALWFLGAHGTPAQRALKAVLAVALMGAADEWVQSFLSYRSGDVRDWLVDVSAATVASGVLAALAAFAAQGQPARRVASRRR